MQDESITPSQSAGKPPRNGLGTAAVVLGAVGLVTSVLGAIIFPLLLWTPSILAVVFGAIGIRRASRGEATNRGSALVGLVLGVIGLVAGGLLLAVVVAFINSQ